MQKIAIVGFGFMGRMHAQVYQQLPDAKIVAVVEQQQPTAEKELAKLGLKVPLHATIEAMLAKEDVDVVSICTPTDQHVPNALAAIAANKNVFCEKPLALNATDGERLVQAAGKSGVFMQVGQCIRFWPEYQAFTEFVRSKKAGRLLSLAMQRRSARPAWSAGDWINNSQRALGAALDMHIHDTDYVHHLLGKPSAVTSRATHDSSGWAHIISLYHFDDVSVVAEGGWNYPAQWGFQMAFQAVFETAAVEFDSRNEPTLVITSGSQQRQPLPFSQPTAKSSAGASGNVSSLGGYYNELAYFIECLEAKKPPQIATPQQALESLRTVLAEIESAEKGKTIAL